MQRFNSLLPRKFDVNFAVAFCLSFSQTLCAFWRNNTSQSSVFCSITDLSGMLIRNNMSLACILLVKPASHFGRGGSRKTDGEGVKHTLFVRKTAFSQALLLAKQLAICKNQWRICDFYCIVGKKTSSPREMIVLEYRNNVAKEKTWKTQKNC